MKKKLFVILPFLMLLYFAWSDDSITFIKTYDGCGNDYISSGQLIQDGGCIIIGHTNSFGVGGDVYLIKTDSRGNEIGAKTFGGNNWDRGDSVQQTQDGGYVIIGHKQSIQFGDYDAVLIKINS
jgi:hypothetical protein